MKKVLLHRGEPVSITPKIYDLLCFLVKNHSHLVEKDSIMDEVWADSFVEESNLTYSIRQLRKILKDDARNPKFIETVPRRGYRFIAEVSEVNSKTDKYTSNFILENESKEFITDKLSDKSLSKNYLVQRNLLLIITLGILIVFGIFSINSLTVNEKSFTSKNLSIKTIKTNGKSLITTISPDGKYIAYSDESDEKVSLWLQNIDTSEKKQILPPGDVYYFGVAFSNDGNSIYFVRNKQAGNKADIYRVSTFGGIPEKIIKHAEGWISLSPDDKHISFVRADENSNYSLYTADSDGKNEQKLVTKQYPGTIGANRFLPDGQSIAYAAGQSDDGTSDFRLIKIDLENKVKTEITPQTFYVIKNLSWMPNGKDLLISASDSHGKPLKLWKVSGDTKRAEKLLEDSAKYSNLSLDKAGKRLLATKLTNNFQISLSSFSSPNSKKLLATANTANFISDSEIVYSNAEGELWKIDINGKGQRQLTNSDSINNTALISPNKKHIYFKSNRSGSKQIWRMDTDGSNKIQITKKVGGDPKFISSGQNQLFYESNLYGTIWKVSANGDDLEKEIWDKKLFYSAFTEDGTKIAYLYHNESKEKQLQIEIYKIEDKSLIRKISLLEKGLKPVRLAWLADNKTLLYITKDEFDYKLWKQNIYSDSQEFIADIGKEQIRDFSVSPNGENFILISGEWLQDVILIEGFN
jgi:Tol biopolymer transport system component